METEEVREWFYCNQCRTTWDLEEINYQTSCPGCSNIKVSDEIYLLIERTIDLFGAGSEICVKAAAKYFNSECARYCLLKSEIRILRDEISERIGYQAKLGE